MSDNDQVWITRDGRHVPISEMTTEHLLNTIRFLRRRAMAMQLEVLGRMNAYIVDAPDAAAMACQAEADQIIDMTEDEFLAIYIRQWKNLLAEAERRQTC